MKKPSSSWFLLMSVVIALAVNGSAGSGNHDETVPVLGHELDNETDYHLHDVGHGNSSHDEHGHGEHNGIHVASNNFDYVKSPLIVSLFLVAVVICKIVFHKIPLLSNYVPESCVLILLGVAVGGILHAAGIDKSEFYYMRPDSFFLFLLPPCILESSYSLHNVVFFQNLGTVLLYAVIGTVLNCFIIGLLMYAFALAGAMGSLEISLIQCLVFSSLIVAVDPVAVLAIFQEIGVNQVLYFLVFGESLLNDAVTVVLYNTMKTLCTMEEIPPSEIGLAFAAFFTVSLGGLSIGIIFGLVTSFVTRFTEHVRVVEPLEMFAMAYAAYLTAEGFHFSGIISMIGCGLIQKHYAWNNISQNSATTVEYFVKMLSTTCDAIIFLLLGIALVRDDLMWNTGFVLLSILVCLLARFFVTVLLTLFANFTYRERKVDAQETFIMSYGGLRGAVCFCLVASLDVEEVPAKFVFQTAVFANIIFTVFIQGITIKPLVNKLHVMLQPKAVTSLYQEINNHIADHTLVALEDIIGHVGENRIKEGLVHIDELFCKVFSRTPLTHDQHLMLLYRGIAMQQYEEIVYGDEAETASEFGELYPTNDYLRKQNVIVDVPAQLQGEPDSKLQRITDLWSRSVRRSLSVPPPVYDELTREDQLKHLSVLLKKTSALNAFTRKSDRNLKNCDETELLHHLHEKQLRHERCMRSQSSCFVSPQVSRRPSIQKTASVDYLKAVSSEFQKGQLTNETGAKTTSSQSDDLTELPPGVRRRHKSVGAKQEVSSVSTYPSTRDAKMHGIFVRQRDRRFNGSNRRRSAADAKTATEPAEQQLALMSKRSDESNNVFYQSSPNVTGGSEDDADDQTTAAAAIGEVTLLLDGKSKQAAQVQYSKPRMLQHEANVNGDQ